jgi:hypothetical protein
MGLQVFVSSWIIDGCLRNDAHMLAHTRPPGSLPFVDCGMDHCAIHRVEVDVGAPEAGPSLPGGQNEARIFQTLANEGLTLSNGHSSDKHRRQ